MYVADPFDSQHVERTCQELDGWAESYSVEISAESLPVRAAYRRQSAAGSLGRVGTQAADHTAQALVGIVAVAVAVAGLGTAVVAGVGTVVPVGWDGTVRTEPVNVMMSAGSLPSRYTERPPDMNKRCSSGHQAVKQKLDVDSQNCSRDKAGTAIAGIVLADTVLADTVIAQARSEEDYWPVSKWTCSREHCKGLTYAPSCGPACNWGGYPACCC